MMRAKNDEVTAPNLTQLKNGQAWMKIVLPGSRVLQLFLQHNPVTP